MIPSTPTPAGVAPLLDATDDVPFLPREVVVVLHVEQHLHAEVLGDVLVNHCVIGSGVMAH
jgi:hypothetical protein